MPQVYPVDDFLNSRSERVVLDVRSPKEYAQGHIPSAISFPLFSDEERAHVGSFYKQQGPEAALELGLKYVGPKMARFVREAKRLAPDRKVAVHCWRGGQRSGSIAWLLRFAKFDVITLLGGYKSYRQHVLSHFEKRKLNIRIVGGKTGSGKTKVLHALRDLGEQIIDLEALAHHKGSSFGSIGEAPQPTVEQFENLLYEKIMETDPQRVVWIENESRSIGRVFIPDHFWAQMKNAPLFNIEIPQKERIQNLLEDYVKTDRHELEKAFQRIAKKLGGLQLKTALEALQQGDYGSAAGIALGYYDKTYQHCLDINVSPEIRQFNFDHGDPVAIAKLLSAQ